MLQEPSGTGAACPELEQTQQCALPAANAASQALHASGGGSSGLAATSGAGASAGSHAGGSATEQASSRPASAGASLVAGIAGVCLIPLAVAGVAVSGVARRLRGSSGSNSRQGFTALPQAEANGEATAATAPAPADRGRRVAGTAAAAALILLGTALLLRVSGAPAPIADGRLTPA
jgi:hypothetical protein